MNRIACTMAACLVLVACTRRPSPPDGEACLTCHGEMTGFMPGHDPATIGCASCHLGDPDATDATVAHAGMVRIPGNLDATSMTCSATGCHPGIDYRVRASLMNTMRGVVGVDRFAFGESPTPDGLTPIQEIGDSPADTHLRNLCASCHLGAEKAAVGPVNERSRGGGCLACHLDYDREALRSYALGGLPRVHPQLSIHVDNEHCFGCHSRSGRIATNYEGWHETLLPPAQARGREDLRVLADDRVFRFVSDDLHHAAGLDCIDCHDGMEIMGDGQGHLHKEDAVSIVCDDCHVAGPLRTRPWTALPPDEQRMVRLRGQEDTAGDFLVRQRSGRTLTNVRLDDGGHPVLITKNGGRQHRLNPPAAACTRGTVHDALNCSACHAGWAPQCISCHTSFRPDEPGYDLLHQQDTSWSWHESPGDFLAGLPTLGVRVADDGTRRIIPFVPGMILDLDLGRVPDALVTQRHHRLFAPTEPHTTVQAGRDCVDCHLDPVALGYGRGSLALAGTEWSFTPVYAPHPADGLPLDAWIGFLKDGVAPHSTRTHTRPFTVEEQSVILRTGACLTCHEGSSAVMQATLAGFEPVAARMRPACRIP